LVSAYRSLDGGAARAFLNGVVQAADQKEANAQIERANHENDENRRNKGEFHCGSAAIVVQHTCQRITYRHPNRIHAVLVIGDVNVPATVMPGNSGA